MFGCCFMGLARIRAGVFKSVIGTFSKSMVISTEGKSKDGASLVIGFGFGLDRTHGFYKLAGAWHTQETRTQNLHSRRVASAPLATTLID